MVDKDTKCLATKTPKNIRSEDTKRLVSFERYTKIFVALSFIVFVTI